jgi:hypothetical protein
MTEEVKEPYHIHQIPVSFSHEDYDGRKDVWFERTFRFRNINELSHLYTRERSRIIKAQKDREDYEKYWYINTILEVIHYNIIIYLFLQAGS